MSASKSQLDEARSDAKRECCAVFDAVAVKKYHETSSGSGTRILVLTDIFASYYDKSGEERTRYYWNQLKSISCGSGDAVVLTFLVEGMTKNTYHTMKFKPKDVRSVISTIGSIVCRVKAPHEVRELNLESYGVEAQLPNGRGLLSRFLGACFLLRSIEFRTIRDLFERDFAIHKPIVLLNEEKSVYFEAFLSGVSIGEWCECVHATYPALRAVVRYMEAASSVVHLHLSRLVTEKWDKFCSRLSDLRESSFKGWTLEETELSDAELETLAHSIDTFTSIGFISTLRDPALFFGAGAVDRLEFVRIERTAPFNLDSVLPRLMGVKILSLADCQFELEDAFRAISVSGLQNLRFIDLSRNKCTVTPLNDGALPTVIQRIDVNDIQWGRNCLIGFLENVLNAKWDCGLHLCISRFQSSDDVDEVFRNADRYPLRHLSWNGNPVTKYFVRHISESSQLSSLYVNDCFTQSSDVFNKFCEAVRDLTNLRVLSVTGSAERCLKDSLGVFFDIVTQSSLQMVDVSGHGISTSLFGRIPDFCRANPRLTWIACDRNQVATVECFQNLLSGIRALGRPITFKYPEIDIQSMHEQKIIDNNVIKALKAQFNCIELPENPDDEVYWDRPFDIDQPSITDAFPEYITPSMAAAMADPFQSARQKSVASRTRKESSSESSEFAIKPRRKVSDSDSNPRPKRRVSDSDSEVPRPKRRTSSVEPTPKRRISDSDSAGVKKRRKLLDSDDEEPKRKRKVSDDDDEKRPRRKLSLESTEVKKPRRKLDLSSDDDDVKPKRRASDSSSDRPRNKSSRKAAPVRKIVFSDSDSEPPRKSTRNNKSKRMLSSDSEERPARKSSRRKLDIDDDEPARKSSRRKLDLDDDEPARKRGRRSDDRKESRRNEFPIDVTGKSTTKKTMMDLEDKFSMENLARAIID